MVMAFRSTAIIRSTRRFAVMKAATSADRPAAAKGAALEGAPSSGDAKGRRRALVSGVVFDMDGTLTVPNIDFKEMYRRCGVDRGQDILEAIALRPRDERLEAERIIDEVEEDSRRTLELMPGATALINFLEDRGIPMAIVTRNTKKTVDRLQELLESDGGCRASFVFSPAITRDDPPSLPPKPDPAALYLISSSWKMPTASLLMVGDSPSNDIVSGNAAGAHTMLLDTGRRFAEKNFGHEINNTMRAEVVVESLQDAPFMIEAHFELPPMTAAAKDALRARVAPLAKYEKPEPRSDACKAAAAGDIDALRTLHGAGALGNEDTDDEAATAGAGRNSPLIWAAEFGHQDAVSYLLSLPATRVNHQGFLGATALHRACHKGFADVISSLLSHPSTDPNIPNVKMQYPLHFAAFKRQHASVREMLRNSGVSTTVTDRKGRTPAEDTSDESIREAIYAARRGDLEAVEAWLSTA